MSFKHAALITLASLCTLSAHAQFKKPEHAVEYRESVFTVMGSHFGRIGAVVKGEKPFDQAALEKDVAIVEMMAQLPWSAFTPNSNIRGSEAKPAVWKEPEKFQQAAKKTQEEIGKLSAAVKTGNLDTIKVAFAAVGQLCKACHDTFKSK